MMRLRRLTLETFGRFSAKSYDFGPPPPPGTPDFHIIHGPNEAGKTTTMEAYLRLLYGFPHRDPYDFLHQRKNLRLSGLFDTTTGPLAVTRLPTRAPSLRDAQGATLPESVLAGPLGGVSEEEYRKLLCLDDRTIEEGGEEIARARGDVGRLLFSAAAGIDGLTEALDATRAEADALYRKRASTTRIAALKRARDEIEEEIRTRDVPASAYRRARQALEAARVEEAEAEAERATLLARQAETEAQLRARPLLDEIAALDAALEGFADWPERLDIDPEGLVRLATDEARARTDEERLKKSLSAERAALEALPRDAVLAALAPALGDLDAPRSRHATAALDLPRRRAALDEARAAAQAAARTLGAAPQASPPDAAQTAALEHARNALGEARRRLDDEEAELDRLAERAEEARADHEAAGESAALAALLARHDAEALATRHAAAEAALAEARRLAAEALDALAPGAPRVAPLPEPPLPLEAAEALVETLRALAPRLEQARDACERIATEAEEDAARAEALRSGAALVDDAQTEALRAERDALWTAHRAALDTPTAARFEAAMAALDAALARREGQAADLARLRLWTQEAAARAPRLARAQAHCARLEDEAEAARARLATAAARVAVSPVPEAFLGWLRRHASAQAAQAAVERLEREHAATLAEAAALSEALAPLLPDAAPRFAARLAAARVRHDRGRAAQERLAGIARERARHEGLHAARSRDAEAAVQGWNAALEAAFPGGVDAAALELSLQPLQDWRVACEKAAGLAHQVATMEDDQRAFIEAVAALHARAGLTPGADPLVAFDALSQRVRDARDAEVQAGQARARIAAQAQALDDTRAALDGIAAEIARLGTLLPAAAETGDLEALRRSLARAAGVIEQRARRAERIRDLLTTLGAAGLSEARAAMEGATQTALVAGLAALRLDLDASETRLRGAIEARATAEATLRGVGGDDAVALLTERRMTLDLELREAALEHLALSLGHRLADEAIRRYRDAHRGAMMQAAETAFAALTNGAYTRLETRRDGERETLVALGAEGMAKEAGDMSKGTRFQLYLALRAAAYEQRADLGQSLPFFCDDIFETFDEERTRAACGLMARIGLRGQAIYLTHHRHVVEIAREICGDAVRVHEIGGA